MEARLAAEPVSRLLARLGAVEPVRGGARGYCLVCGSWTEEGVPARDVFSGNFTEYNRLPGRPLPGAGVLCPYCAGLARARELRRRSWLATPGGVEYVDRGRALETLLDPPEPPWYMYLTRAGKKAGFLYWPWPNYSRRRYIVVVDVDRVALNADRARSLARLAREALESGLKKSELLEGCRVKSWGAHRELCEAVEAVRRDPAWWVIVWLA